jgi:uncharacterized protein (DUF849 family)
VVGGLEEGNGGSVIRRLKACLNGGRPPAVAPATPRELAAAAVAAVAAGAEAVHVHPRAADGRESLAAGDVGAAVAAVREACPGTAVGVTTGLWIVGGDSGRRAAEIARWTVQPDFASVNVHEEGFAELVRMLGSEGVTVEAGVWHPEEADELAGLPVTRALVEIIDVPAVRAEAAADEILARLDAAGFGGERLVHGEDESCWGLVAHAGRLGLPTRIGFEDTLVLPDGTPAPDNAALVRAALRVWAAGGRPQ